MKITCLVLCLSFCATNLFAEGSEWDSPATATSEAAGLFKKGAASVKAGKYDPDARRLRRRGG